MPWSFEYKGHPITHEDDECYLIPTILGMGTVTPLDMLVTDSFGNIYPQKIKKFEEEYVSYRSSSCNCARVKE